MPFFTVILPTYNRAKSILGSVESVLAQTLKDFELIIIDDGSTDNTSEILKPVLARDERVKYVYQENAERSAARNNGIEIASGDYICFLDSDDMYLPNHLAKFKQTILKFNHTKALYYCSGIMDDGSKRVSIDNALYTGTTSTLEHLLTTGAIGTVFVCLPRPILKHFKFNVSISVGEDKELWSRILVEHKLIYSPQHTVVVNDHVDRTVSVNNLDSAKKSLSTVKFICQNLKSHIPASVAGKALAGAYYRLALSHSKNNQRLHSLFYAFVSIFHSQDKYTASVMVFIVKELLKTFRLPEKEKS